MKSAGAANYAAAAKTDGKEKNSKQSTVKDPKDRVELGSSGNGKNQLLLPAGKAPLMLPKPPAGEKELTVMFYMHGQYDDISESAAKSMMSLEKAGSDENVNLVAQLGRNPYKPKEEGEFHIPVDNDWSGVRRYNVAQSDHEQLDIPVEEWEKMESIMPRNPVLQFVLGNIYWAMGQKDKGMACYNKSKDLGMLKYMNEYDSDWSKSVREEFDRVTRPFEEASAPFNNFASKAVETLPDGTKMGDPATLENFVNWGMKKYPAKHYMLVVMGHGGAWIGAAEQSPQDMGKAVVEGVSHANQETGRNDKIDVAMFNSCYMGNVEALYEMKDTAGVTLASENYARSGIFGHWGMFLNAVQNDLKDGKPFDGKQFAAEIVDFYKDQGKEVKENFPEFSAWKESYLTLSAVDNSKLDELAGSFTDFVTACNKYNVPDHILFKEVQDTKNYDSNAHNPSQLFGFYDTIRDLGSFMDNVRRNPDIPVEVKDAAAHVTKDLKACLINEQHEGQGMEGSQGITFWGPTNGVDVAFMGKRYADDVGHFSKSTGWGKKLVQAAKNIPQPIMTGFMGAIDDMRSIKAKLANPETPEAEKETLKKQLEELNTKALEYKKQMDFTLERSEGKDIFKGCRRLGINLKETAKKGRDFVDEAISSRPGLQ